MSKNFVLNFDNVFYEMIDSAIYIEKRRWNILLKNGVILLKNKVLVFINYLFIFGKSGQEICRGCFNSCHSLNREMAFIFEN